MMCKEAILAFAGHDFIRIFSIAEVGYNAAILDGKKKSFYTHTDEKKNLACIKDYKKQFEKANETINPYHEHFLDKYKWIIPVLIEELQRAIKNKAIISHEWLKLLEWWFEEVNLEFKREIK